MLLSFVSLMHSPPIISIFATLGSATLSQSILGHSWRCLYDLLPQDVHVERLVELKVRMRLQVLAVQQ